MNILILYQDIDGGTKNATEAIIQKLRIVDPTGIYTIYKQPDIPRLNRFHYTYHLLWSTYDFYRVLQSYRSIDIIYFNIFTVALAKIFSRHRKTKSFFHFHGNQEFAQDITSEKNRSFAGIIYNSILGNVVNYLQKIALYHTSIVCFVSEFAKKQFLELHNLQTLDRKTRVVPNGVDTIKFHPLSLHAKKLLRNKLGIQTIEKIVILYSGRIDEKKGVMQLVKALLYLPKKYQLLIVYPLIRERQSRELLNNLLLLTRDQDFDSRVTFIENPSNIELYYQIADCTVLPSEREYFSLVILESFASGTPFLGTKVGFIPEFLAGVNRNLLLPSNNPMVIARRILWLGRLSNAKKAKLIQTGLRKANEFTWETATHAIVHQLRRLYSSAV